MTSLETRPPRPTPVATPAALLLLALVGCGPDAPGSTQASQTAALTRPGFHPAPGLVAVDFAVDDRANRVYGPGDLTWKGSFLFDAATRVLAFDGTWSGAAPGGAPLSGWPTLYDDGPWDRGGHEPLGAERGDHVWGVTAFVAPPATGAQAYEYGLTDATAEARLGNGWLWKGANGAFTVASAGPARVVAPGMTFPRFGVTDLVLTLDTTALDPTAWPWDTSRVEVKSSWWGWGTLPMTATGGGRFSFRLSDVLGRAGPIPHAGRLPAGEVPEFVFVLGGASYMGWSTSDGGLTWSLTAFRGGVSAATATPCRRLPSPAPLLTLADGNTAIVVPASCCEEEGDDGRRPDGR